MLAAVVEAIEAHSSSLSYPLSREAVLRLVGYVGMMSCLGLGSLALFLRWCG